jgi:large subunit ribosomal protein L25
MDKIVLKTTKRDVVGKKAGALRRQGKLPAVLYGHPIETTPILLDAFEGS